MVSFTKMGRGDYSETQEEHKVWGSKILNLTCPLAIQVDVAIQYKSLEPRREVHIRSRHPEVIDHI